MGLAYYEPVRGGRSSTQSKIRRGLVPAVRFSNHSMVVNKRARKLLEENGVQFAGKIRIGYNDEDNTIHVQFGQKKGLTPHKTKVFVRGMFKTLDLEWIAGKFVVVDFINGELVGKVENDNINDEDDEEEEAEEEAEEEIEEKTIIKKKMQSKK
ncbi:MAG: hypothetical protein QXL94_01775 [Candidatus Parvarchaeum sp.]